MNRKPETQEAALPKTSVSSDAIARIGPLMNLPALISELGHEPVSILAKYGYKPEQFNNPDFQIHYVHGGYMLEHCVEETGCEEIGLILGMRADPSCLGIAGFMLSTAPDVETALRALVRHFDLHDEGGVPSLKVDGDLSYLGFTVNVPGFRAIDQIYDVSITVACKIMRGFFGETWKPTEVLLSRSRPKKLNPYRNFFNAPICFDTERSAVVFPTHLLKQKLPGNSPLHFEYLDSKATELHGKRDTDLIGRLHRFIRSALITQDCTAGAAAQYLGINVRTLNRRLRNEGTTFRQELNNLRYAMAQSFLANSDAKQMEIALALGYLDATSFNRSFKRWSGISPEEWRIRNKPSKTS